jgi:hypothetical protein
MWDHDNYNKRWTVFAGYVTINKLAFPFCVYKIYLTSCPRQLQLVHGKVDEGASWQLAGGRRQAHLRLHIASELKRKFLTL